MNLDERIAEMWESPATIYSPIGDTHFNVDVLNGPIKQVIHDVLEYVKPTPLPESLWEEDPIKWGMVEGVNGACREFEAKAKELGL